MVYHYIYSNQMIGYNDRMTPNDFYFTRVFFLSK